MEGYFETIEGRSGGIVGSADGLFMVLEPCLSKKMEKKFFTLLFAFFSNIHLIFCLVSLNFFQLSFGPHVLSSWELWWWTLVVPSLLLLYEM